jgi:hypothetical protein
MGLNMKIWFGAEEGWEREKSEGPRPANFEIKSASRGIVSSFSLLEWVS